MSAIRKRDADANGKKRGAASDDANTKPANQKRFNAKQHGSYGSTVNTFDMVLGTETVTRAEWRHLGLRRTRTFRGDKRTRHERAATFAKDLSAELHMGVGAAVPPSAADTPDAPDALNAVAVIDVAETPAQAVPAAPLPAAVTLDDLFSEWETAHVTSWRPATKRLHAARWRVFVAWTPDGPLASSVTPQLLDRFRNVLATTATKTGQPMAKNQIAHHLTVLKSVFRFGQERGLIAINPITSYKVRIGRDHRALEVDEYAPAEFSRILDHLGYRSSRGWRAWAVIALVGLLGARIHATLELLWSDVDFARRTIRWRGEVDKQGRARVQALPRDAVFILRVCRIWARRQRFTGDYVFYGVQRRTRHTHWTYQALNKALHEAAKKGGVQRKPYRAAHGIRRMVAKDVLELTGDLTLVGRWIGDTDIKVLAASYLRQRDDEMAPVVAGLGLPARHDTGTANRGSPRANGNGQTSGVGATTVSPRAAGRRTPAKNSGPAT